MSDNIEIPVAKELPSDELPLVIGRSADATIRIGDRWASRKHCEIANTAGSWVVRDLGSTHGTLLNGEPITESPLLPGDKLTVGLTTFLVSSDQRRLKSSSRRNQQGAAGSTLLLCPADNDGPEIVEEISKKKPR